MQVIWLWGPPGVRHGKSWRSPIGPASSSRCSGWSPVLGWKQAYSSSIDRTGQRTCDLNSGFCFESFSPSPGWFPLKEASSHAVGQLCELTMWGRTTWEQLALWMMELSKRISLPSSPYSSSKPSEEATAWLSPDSTHEKTRCRGTTLGML